MGNGFQCHCSHTCVNGTSLHSRFPFSAFSKCFVLIYWDFFPSFFKNLEEKIQSCLELLVSDNRLGKLFLLDEFRTVKQSKLKFQLEPNFYWTCQTGVPLLPVTGLNVHQNLSWAAPGILFGFTNGVLLLDPRLDFGRDVNHYNDNRCQRTSVLSP